MIERPVVRSVPAPPRRGLLAALALVAAACGNGAPAAPGAGDFLALTYNVAGLPEGISGSRPSIYTAQISPLLNGYDLVLVQESWQTIEGVPDNLRFYHEVLAADASHPYRSEPARLPLGTDARRPEALVSDGLNMFSIFPFEPLVRVPWRDCDPSAADCLALKGFSLARTTLAPGVEVDIYDLHMEAGNNAHDRELRDQGVSQLRDFMLDASAGRAIIVGGDFNLNTDSEPDRTQYRRLLDEVGLADACETLSCPDFDRIDKFAFRSGGGVEIRATGYRVEDDVFVTPLGEPLSDHEAVAVRFAWAAAP